MVTSVQKRNVWKHLYSYFSLLPQVCICWRWLQIGLVAVSWHFPTVFICIGIPLITSYCLCLSPQCPLSSTEPLLHPTPWPTVAAFPFITQSPRCPSHPAFCCLALLKAPVQLTPFLCALPLIFMHFLCSATQFPPLIPGSSALLWLSAPHQPDIVSNAAYRSSSNVLLFCKCSVISPSHLASSWLCADLLWVLCTAGTCSKPWEIKASLLWVGSLRLF